MGQEAMQAWASVQVNVCEQEVRRTGRAHRSGKKLCWHTTFGDISVEETQYRSANRKIRPFAQSAQVTARDCSRLLERVLTDFGVDTPYWGSGSNGTGKSVKHFTSPVGALHARIALREAVPVVRTSGDVGQQLIHGC